MTRIAFRTDATSQIGTGHFMRCLTLAEALKKRGAKIRFISRGLPSHLRDMLSAKGIEFSPLENQESSVPAGDLAHAHWLGVSQAQDAAATMPALSDHSWDWLIVDHYALDARWEHAMRNVAKRIMVIDDIADRKHDCDILLDQNFYADMQTRYADKVPAHCLLLLGPRYALLREEFSKLREQVKPRSGPVKRILVFFGGVDADNYTGRAIKALANMGAEGLLVDVVIGAQHPCRAEIEADCAAQGFVCHAQTNRMAELMAAADLAIGAGGSATWERCCLGLPTLAICAADNQKRQIADAALEGLLCSPEIRNGVIQMIQSHTNALMENSSLRQHISLNSMRAIDGRGVLHVIRELDCVSVKEDGDTGIYIRLAVIDDAKLVWPWRNNETTRRYFFDSSPVSLETHLAWWNRSLSDPKRILLIGMLEDKEVGVIRYDLVDSRKAEISIYIDPTMTGRGIGRNLLRAGQRWMKQNYPQVDEVIAEVMSKNITSLRLFIAAGFHEQHKVLLLKGNK